MRGGGWGVAVAQSIEHVTAGEEVVGLIPTGWVCVSIMCPAETEVIVSSLSLVAAL